MTLLIDMNLSPLWVTFLTESGVPSIYWSSVGANDAPDIEILAYAKAYGLCILTRDRDFAALLALGNRTKPSVIFVRSQVADPLSIGSYLLRALRQLQPELEAGAIVTLDPPKTRIRLLPLRTDANL